VLLARRACPHRLLLAAGTRPTFKFGPLPRSLSTAAYTTAGSTARAGGSATARPGGLGRAVYCIPPHPPPSCWPCTQAETLVADWPPDVSLSLRTGRPGGGQGPGPLPGTAAAATFSLHTHRGQTLPADAQALTRLAAGPAATVAGRWNSAHPATRGVPPPPSDLSVAPAGQISRPARAAGLIQCAHVSG
jgi:hypothetical protein